ncbi:MAG: flippase [Patescibacteria group bacterium]|jgi:O-antigen/teichoic acid export membrane protein
MNHVLQKGLQYAKNNTIIKNTLSLGAGQILTKAVSLFSVPIIARLLGVDGFGQYTLVFSFVMIFSGLSDWGIHKLTIREVARDNTVKNSFFVNTLVLRLVLAVFFYSILIGAAFLFDYPEATTTLIIVLGSLILANSIINTFVAMLNAEEKMSFSAGLLFIQSLLSPLVIIPILYFKIGLLEAFLILVSLNIILAIGVGIYLSKKMFSFNYRDINLGVWKKIFRDSWPYALMAIFWMIYINNGSIILSKITDIGQVGIYNAGLKLVLALFFIPGSLMMAFFPSMSRQIAQENKDQIKKSCEKTLKILFWVIIPIAVLILSLSDFVIPILFGENFADASKVLKVLTISLVLFFINSPLGYVILSTQHIKKYIPYDFAIMLFNLCLGIILSFKYGPVGPAIALIFSETLSIFVRLFFIRRNLQFSVSFKSLFIPKL